MTDLLKKLSKPLLNRQMMSKTPEKCRGFRAAVGFAEREFAPPEDSEETGS